MISYFYASYNNNLFKNLSFTHNKMTYLGTKNRILYTNSIEFLWFIEKFQYINDK